MLLVIASGEAGFDLERRLSIERLRRAFAGRVLAVVGAGPEIVMTFMFLMIILGATDARAPKGSRR